MKNQLNKSENKILLIPVALLKLWMPEPDIIYLILSYLLTF